MLLDDQTDAQPAGPISLVGLAVVAALALLFGQAGGCLFVYGLDLNDQVGN